MRIKKTLSSIKDACRAAASRAEREYWADIEERNGLLAPRRRVIYAVFDGSNGLPEFAGESCPWNGTKAELEKALETCMKAPGFRSLGIAGAFDWRASLLDEDPAPYAAEWRVIVAGDETEELDEIVCRRSGFGSFQALLDAPGDYRPTILCSRERNRAETDDGLAELLRLANAYDEAQAARGDQRRAYRGG